MKRLFWLLLAAVFWLAACQPAAPATIQAPTQKPAEQQPAAKPTEAPALPAHPAPATRAPLSTARPGFNPPISGGVLNPPTHVPTPGNNPAGATIRQNLWQQEVLTNTPPARYDHAFAFEFEVYTMIAFGGQAQSALGDTWIYSQSKWFKLSPKTTPPPRFGAEAAYTSGSYPLIFGGQSAKQFFNDVWKYNGPAQKWEQIATTGNGPAPRAGASLGVETNPLREPYHNLLFVTHGYSDREYFDDTFVLDLSTNTWREISPANRPSKRKGQAGTFDDQQGKLFLLGGQDVV
ncbi:MAG TPA: kelch repeat-containing protein, partial [Anaerolineae bacterium]|nr:kelch repeat-containing protein [Anaerolineae bacterium]